MKGEGVADLVDGVKSFGLTTATATMVAKVKKQFYPNGTAGVDQGEVVKSVIVETCRRGNAMGG